MDDLIQRLIAATNAFDVETALALFSSEAVIEDVSVGGKFEGAAGVRRYLEKFFVGYHTVSIITSIERKSDSRAIVRLDFTGDFGHETGFLDVTIDAMGLIASLDADLD